MTDPRSSNHILTAQKYKMITITIICKSILRCGMVSTTCYTLGPMLPRLGVINMIASVKPPPREPGRRPQTEQYHCMTACGRVELPCCIIPPQNWPSSPLSPVSLMFNSAISSWSDLNVGYMLNFNTPLTIKRWCVRYFGYFRIIVWINAIKSRRN